MTEFKNNGEALIEQFSEEKMRNISASIIEAYRKNDRKTLHHFAAILEISAGDLKAKPAAAFRKMMLFYHPDRRFLIHRKIRQWTVQENRQLLEKLARCIKVSIPRVQSQPEAQENFESGYYNPFTEDLTGEEYLHTENDSTRTDESEVFEFIEAVRSLMYGNLYSEFLPKDLYHLDGELDLSEEGISDLTGIEYCINITELILSRNRIDNLRDLSGLSQLITLDLSRNAITYIDDLEGLSSLRNLDLSFNEIENTEPLEHLPDLRFINLVGNPLQTADSVNRLKKKGIIVISDN